jgi:hypothetical protein
VSSVTVDQQIDQRLIVTTRMAPCVRPVPQRSFAPAGSKYRIDVTPTTVRRRGSETVPRLDVVEVHDELRFAACERESARSRVD